MSAGNLFTTRQSAFGLRRKVVDADYTVRVGGDERNFETDRVIAIVDPAAALTITVPDGEYEGQELLITYVSGTTYDATITVTTGADYTFTVAGDYCSLEWVNSITDIGWISLSNKETA